MATTGSYTVDIVRNVMLAAIKQRFGNVPKALAEIEWLTDNGSGYIAGETREFATDIGPKPSPMPICSPQRTAWRKAP